MKQLRLLIALFLVTMPLASLAAMLQFPALTGRVVDEAHLLTSSAKEDLEAALAAQERKTGNQIVVVTVTSLQGVPIEDFGYRLGRYWGIGQKDKNNGVVLLIAPTEKQIRIDVGYGLEGVLTDAISSQIINTIIVPEFKAGAVQEGIVKGAEAIIAVVDGGIVPQRSATEDHSGMAFLLLFAIIFFSQLFLLLIYGVLRIIAALFSLLGFNGLGRALDAVKARHYPQGRAFWPWLLTPTMRWNGSSGGGGGFSGGGGSFGGGGSSGRW